MILAGIAIDESDGEVEGDFWKFFIHCLLGKCLSCMVCPYINQSATYLAHV